MSTAAGIVITRAASEVNLGFEVTRQVLISPKAIGTASGILLAMGLVSRIAASRVLALGSLTGWMAFQINEQQKVPPRSLSKASPADQGRGRRDAGGAIGSHGSAGGLRPHRPGRRRTGGHSSIASKGLRRQFAEHMGFVLPPIHIRDNLQYCGRMNMRRCSKASNWPSPKCMPAHVLAIDPGTAQRGIIHGLPTKGAGVRVAGTLGSPTAGTGSNGRPYRGRSRVGHRHLCPNSSSGMRTSCWVGRKQQGLLDQLGKITPSSWKK